ncbi:MAG: methyltransferase domain-containing protein [Ferruginibacter sp.]
MPQQKFVEIIQSDWLEEILADPISKTTLKRIKDGYSSENGFGYSIKDKVPDFRIKLNQFENEWQKGQDAFEPWLIKYLDNAESDPMYYINEQKRDAPMYQKLPLEGRVLDVGGQLGNIRKYMTDDQPFCSVDPFIHVYKVAAGRTNLFKHYPLHLPLNFLAGFAEFLPFKASVFDTINMRSCIDHFFNPQLSLLEANRVLRGNGKLLIGMTVKVSTIKNTLKETTRSVLGIFTSRFDDNHIWHPTRNEMVTLCGQCGFKFEDEIWQSENVWYGAFRKNTGELVNIT